METFIFIVIIFVLTITLMIVAHKYYNLYNKYDEEKDMFLYNKNKISMIEYHYRNFKEGQNPFTTLRDISNTLKDIYPTDFK